MRLTLGEKNRALDLVTRNGLTMSQLVRVLIQLPADCVSGGACTAVVLNRVSAGRLERETRRWGNLEDLSVTSVSLSDFHMNW